MTIEDTGRYCFIADGTNNDFTCIRRTLISATIVILLHVSIIPEYLKQIQFFLRQQTNLP